MFFPSFHFCRLQADMTQFPNCAVSLPFHFNAIIFPRYNEYMIISFSISLLSLIKSLLLNLRNLYSWSQQGSKNREIKALETCSAY